MTKHGHKHIEIAELAASQKPRVIAITESHLDSSYEDGEIDIPGGNKKGGGVVVYVREEVELERISRKGREDFEMVAFNMPDNIRYMILYRPPGGTVSEELMKTIEKEMTRKGRSLLAGDLNMNTQAKRPTPKALNLMLGKELGMEQKVGFVTRHNARGGSIIDHAWTGMQCKCSPVRAADGLSDHKAVKVFHPQQAVEEPSPPKHVWKRKWHKASKEEMVRIITEEMSKVGKGRNNATPKRKSFIRGNAEEEMMARGVGNDTGRDADHRQPRHQQAAPLHEVMEAWETAWERIKKDVAPLVKVKVRKKPTHKAWFTDQIKQNIESRNEKEKALRNAVAETQAQAEQELRGASKQVRQAIIHAKRGYFQAKVAELPQGKITDRKEGWAIQNEVAGRKRKCSVLPVCSADEINKAFLGKVERIRAPLLGHPLREPEKRCMPEMAQFQHITGQDVTEALKKDRG
eukprot:gene9979-3199_t